MLNTTTMTSCLDLFEAQVQRAPDQLAVLDGDRAFTYRDLHTRSLALAHALRGAGVQAGDIAGLCAERSAEATIGMLALWHCGAAYLPLDPALPPARTTFYVQDARVRLILVPSRFQDRLPAGLAHLSLDEEPRIVSETDTAWQEPPYPLDGEALACVLYTSGSTGVPKGVLIPHRGIVRLVHQADYLQVTPSDRLAHSSSLSFDLSLLEIWAALANGATLVAYPTATVLDPARFLPTLRQDGITTLFATTALFQRYACFAPAAFSGLRAVFFGGEAADAGACRTVLRAGPPQRLVNIYGPTENTVLSTCYEIGDLPEEAKSVPIGRPISQTTVYLLDEAGNLVQEVGVPAEIWVGGEGVARGYLNRPDLTVACFVEHPQFGRLYRTGDLAWYHADGNLEFGGRRDFQVKLHGVRIELGGIETLLCQHPAIQAAVVVVQGEGEAKHLVAYLVASADPPSALVLRSYLAEHLAEQSLPSQFVLLPQLPLTPTGKVDRQRLAETDPRLLGALLPEPSRREDCEDLVQACYAQALNQAADTLAADRPLRLDSLASAEVASHLAVTFSLDQQTTHALLPLIVGGASIHEVALALGTLLRLRRDAQPPPAPRPSPSAPRAKHSPVPSFVTLSTRPLFPHLRAGELAPLTAAALAYLPALPEEAARQMVQAWHQGKPVLTHLVDLPSLGRIGLFSLPFEGHALAARRAEVKAACTLALQMAEEVGARVVSLTGLLPSALDYGRTLLDLPRSPQVRLTTGHATTAAAVALNLERLVEIAGRALHQECVAIVGLGSIGRAVLRLLLRVLPHPCTLLLCDLSGRLEDRLVETLRQEYGFRGEIVFVPTQAGLVPEGIYQRATCIIGATNVASVLDIWRLSPGCLVLDDSGPHCFRVAEAITRMREVGDVLIAEAGELHVPEALHETRYQPPSPEGIAWLMQQEEMLALRKDPHEIMSCLVSGLLVEGWQVPATLDLVDVAQAEEHYRTLRAHGWGAARPHLCSEHALTAQAIERFREAFGKEKR